MASFNAAKNEMAEIAGLPEREVAAPLGDVRGVCGKCNEPVYASQERDKDTLGVYYHVRAADCSYAD